MQGHTIDPLDPSPSVRGSQISESSVVLPLFSPLSLMRTLWVEFDLIIPKAFQGQGGNMGSTSDSPDFNGCCQYKMITNTQVQIQMLNFGTKLSLRASTGVGWGGADRLITQSSRLWSNSLETHRGGSLTRSMTSTTGKLRETFPFASVSLNSNPRVFLSELTQKQTVRRNHWVLASSTPELSVFWSTFFSHNIGYVR